MLFPSLDNKNNFKKNIYFSLPFFFSLHSLSTSLSLSRLTIILELSRWVIIILEIWRKQVRLEMELRERGGGGKIMKNYQIVTQRIYKLTHKKNLKKFYQTILLLNCPKNIKKIL